HPAASTVRLVSPGQRLGVPDSLRRRDLMNTDPPLSSPTSTEPSTVPYVGSGPDASASASVKLPTFEAPTPPLQFRDRAAALANLEAGRCLGDFELVRELGAGSFGRVFLARQLSLGRMVALKVTVEPSGEAQALAALQHDHIVRVFGAEVDARDG